MGEASNNGERTQRHLEGAVLKPQGVSERIVPRRYAPSVQLKAFVRHFWFVRWDLRASSPRVQSTLPLPAVNAVLEADGARVFGPRSRRYDKQLVGRGAAFGALFLPAGFVPFLGRPMHGLVDRELTFADAFGDPAEDLRRLAFQNVATADNDARIQHAFEAFLVGCLPKAAPATEAQRWVTLLESDPTITRVETLAARCDVGQRTLQRTLRDCVGVGPKQLIRRYRLLEAAGRLMGGQAVEQAQLATELGYSDQAHFVRDFRRVVGETPAAYAARELVGRSEPLP